MKRAILVAAVILCGVASSARAQDAAVVAPSHYKVTVDNEHVRVIEMVLKPGEKDVLHTHPAGWYYVTQPGKMKVSFANGKTEMWEPKLGEAAWMESEAPHTSENVGKTTMAFILVEVKSAAKASAAKKDPAAPKR